MQVFIWSGFLALRKNERGRLWENERKGVHKLKIHYSWTPCFRFVHMQGSKHYLDGKRTKPLAKGTPYFPFFKEVCQQVQDCLLIALAEQGETPGTDRKGQSRGKLANANVLLCMSSLFNTLFVDAWIRTYAGVYWLCQKLTSTS